MRQRLLFGSHARGDADAGSDDDILVIEPEVADAARESVRLRTELGDLPVPIDVVVIDRERARRPGSVRGTMVLSAHRARAGLLPTPEEVEAAELLLGKAASDLSGARVVARDPDQQDDVVGLHAQQALLGALKNRDVRGFVDALLSDDDRDLAWRVAVAAPQGELDAEQRPRLAASREGEHPGDALALHQVVADMVLKTADRRASSDGVRILKKAAKGAHAARALTTSRGTSAGCGSSIAVGRR